MARPIKQGMDYFPHDTDAASDEKVEALRILYGNDGYAFYFILLERIYRTSSFELDVSDAETRQILARKVEVTPQKFEDMLATALKRGCFDRLAYDERGVVTSNGIKKRAAEVVGKRQKMALTYAKRVSSAETPQETPPETRQRKVKESKEILNSISESKTPPTPGAGEGGVGSQKKIEAAENSAAEPAAQTQPPVAAPPRHPFGRDPLAFPENLRWPFESDAWRDAWTRFRRHLADMDKAFRGDTHEEAALMRLTGLAGSDEQQALKIINDTIANGWKNLTLDHGNASKQSHHNGGRAPLNSTVTTLSDYGGNRRRPQSASAA